MKIAIISRWFSENMGYSENCLPKALASLGHEVHLITSNLQIYYNSPMYKETYESFIGPAIVPSVVKKLDGYMLHRLPDTKWMGQRRIQGLNQKLFKIRPHVVQTLECHQLPTVEAALAKTVLKYKLFLETHVHASVLKVDRQDLSFLARTKFFVFKNVFGPLISAFSEKCYAISSDAAEIASKNFGIQDPKIKVSSLGVDTDLFKPSDAPTTKKARAQLRQQLGFLPSDIVCIYTGRFSSDKWPQCLARAIQNLVKKGKPFRGLFVGHGLEEDIEAIRDCAGCVVHPFVKANELPELYQAADIGVWPRQESISQLDAAACGLPIILSNKVKVRERVDENGLVYEEGNVLDLAEKINSLTDPDMRAKMGQFGSRKVEQMFSWRHIAEQRIQDYETALGQTELKKYL